MAGERGRSSSLITAPTLKRDFGLVEAGKLLEHTFQFQNVFDGPLLLSLADPTCGCVSVRLDPERVLGVGATASLTIELKPEATSVGSVLSEGVFVNARPTADNVRSSRKSGKSRLPGPGGRESVFFEVMATVAGLGSISTFVVRPQPKYPAENLPLHCKLMTATRDRAFEITNVKSDLDVLAFDTVEIEVGKAQRFRSFFVTVVNIPVTITEAPIAGRGTIHITYQLGGVEESSQIDVIVLSPRE